MAVDRFQSNGKNNAWTMALDEGKKEMKGMATPAWGVGQKPEDAFEHPNLYRRYLQLDDEEDMVNSPDHYASSRIECIDAMEAMMDQGRPPMIKMTGHMYYCWSTIFKYIWRWPFKKNPVEDLKKAEYYLKRLIKRLEDTS